MWNDLSPRAGVFRRTVYCVSWWLYARTNWQWALALWGWSIPKGEV